MRNNGSLVGRVSKLLLLLLMETICRVCALKTVQIVLSVYLASAVFKKKSAQHTVGLVQALQGKFVAALGDLALRDQAVYKLTIPATVMVYRNSGLQD